MGGQKDDLVTVKTTTNQGTVIPDLPLTSDVFETYYAKAIGLSESEFETWLSYLRKPLPASFRIAGPQTTKDFVLEKLNKFHESLSEIPLSKFLPDSPEGLSCAPIPLKWYPDGRAFSLPIDRKTIRTSADPLLKEFHSWITLFYEAGFLVRQGGSLHDSSSVSQCKAW
ncbi:hypothetical protein GEMRC1_010760 [Eukaryota sp. GEM-RC1]